MNDAWDIQPGQVRKILSRTEAEQESLRGVLRDVQNHEATSTTPGAPAIAAFFLSRIQPLQWIDTRITAVVDGTEQAVKAYTDSDLEMAAEQQHHASAIGGPVPSAPR
ncbi:DUF6507 family protein [Myceligenerans crystallogenes]|uniref:Uncharacterized protein n=1 Tax=Myceligenerans crystallogenes TaxID=316335 RepID=A0ABP4ZRF3_9MICO